MPAVSFSRPLSIVRAQTLGAPGVLLRAAALLLVPLLAGCLDDTMSPGRSVGSVEAPAFSLAAPQAPALLVTSRTVSPDGTIDERPFRYDGSSGAYLGQLQTGTSPTSHREMAFGPDGHLYVVDGLGNSVLRYDGTTGASLGAFVPAGRGLGNPSGLAFGPTGDLYVTNGADNRVKQFHGTTGLAVRTYASISDGQSITFRADGIMFVASRGFHDVRRYDAALGRFVVFITAGNGGLSQPTSLRFGPDGHLYVASYGTGSVMRYDGQTGRLIGVFASGNGLVAPGGLTFGPDGMLYVSDFASGSVLRFDGTTGAFRDTFIAPDANGLASPRYLLFTNGPVNTAPVIAHTGPYRADEGSVIGFNAAATTDADGDAMSFAWDFGDGATASGVAPTHAYTDNGSYTAVLTVTDARGASSSAPIAVTIDNAAPVLTAITAPATSSIIGDVLNVRVGFTDAGRLDTHTASINWGDGATTPADLSAGAASGSHAYALAGTYSITVTVTDNDGGASDLAFHDIKVSAPAEPPPDDTDPPGDDTDPPAGSTPGAVIGAGRINSPAGAYPAAAHKQGTASFSIVARYAAGSDAPAGSVSFSLPSATLDLRATAFDKLVIDGAHARVEGTAVVNHSAGYAFSLNVTDAGSGRADALRMRIWHVASGQVIYDNERASAPDAVASSPIFTGSISVQSAGATDPSLPGNSGGDANTTGKPGKARNN